MAKNPEESPLLPPETKQTSFKKGFWSAWGISTLLTAGGEVAARFIPALALPITIGARVAATATGWSINKLLTKPNDGDKLDQGTRFADNVGVQGGLPIVLSWALSAIGVGLEALPILAATIIITGFMQTYDIYQHGKELSEAIELRDQTEEGRRINSMSNGEYVKWKAKEMGKTLVDRSTMLTILTSFLGSCGTGRFDTVAAPVSVPVEMAAHLVGYVSAKAGGKASENWALDLLTAVTTISLTLGIKTLPMLFKEDWMARVICGALGAMFGSMNFSGRTGVREAVETPKIMQRMFELWKSSPASQEKAADNPFSVNNFGAV